MFRVVPVRPLPVRVRLVPTDAEEHARGQGLPIVLRVLQILVRARTVRIHAVTYAREQRLLIVPVRPVLVRVRPVPTDAAAHAREPRFRLALVLQILVRVRAVLTPAEM